MKYFIVLFLMAFCTLMSNSQTYQVYSVKGDVKTSKGIVKKGDKIAGTAVVVVAANCRLVILSEADKKLYIVKVAGKGTLAEMVKKSTTTSQQLSDSYLAFVKSKITGTENTDKNHMQSAGTAYRETDSLLQNVLVPVEKVDTIRKKAK